MIEKSSITSMEVFRKKRISLAKFGLFLALLSSFVLVFFSLFNSGAQTIVLGAMGESTVLATIVTALIVLGFGEFGAGIILILYKLATGSPITEYKGLWDLKASRIVLISALAAGPLATGCLMIAIPLCGITYANSVLALTPMLVALASRIFLKEIPVRRVYIGIAISVIGVMIASYSPPQGVSNFYLGIMFALFCPIGFCVESMVSSRVMDLTDPIEVCGFYRCLFGGLFDVAVPLIICLVFGKMELFLQVFQFVFSSSTALLFVVISAVAIAFQYSTAYISYNYCGPSRGMAITFSTPVWSIPIGYLMASIFPYSVTKQGMVAAFIVVIGMVLIVIKPSELFTMRETA